MSCIPCKRKPKNKRKIKSPTTAEERSPQHIENLQKKVLKYLYQRDTRSRIDILKVPFAELGYESVRQFIEEIPIFMLEPFGPKGAETKHFNPLDKIVWLAPNGRIVHAEFKKYKGLKNNRHQVRILLDLAKLPRKLKLLPFPTESITVPLDEIVHYKDFLRRSLGDLPKESRVIILNPYQERSVDRPNKMAHNQNPKNDWKVGCYIFNRKTNEHAVITKRELTDDHELLMGFKYIETDGSLVERTGQLPVNTLLAGWYLDLTYCPTKPSVMNTCSSSSGKFISPHEHMDDGEEGATAKPVEVVHRNNPAHDDRMETESVDVKEEGSNNCTRSRKRYPVESLPRKQKGLRKTNSERYRPQRVQAYPMRRGSRGESKESLNTEEKSPLEILNQMVADKSKESGVQSFRNTVDRTQDTCDSHSHLVVGKSDEGRVVDNENVVVSSRSRNRSGSRMRDIDGNDEKLPPSVPILSKEEIKLTESRKMSRERKRSDVTERKSRKGEDLIYTMRRDEAEGKLRELPNVSNEEPEIVETPSKIKSPINLPRHNTNQKMKAIQKNLQLHDQNNHIPSHQPFAPTADHNQFPHHLKSSSPAVTQQGNFGYGCLENDKRENHHRTSSLLKESKVDEGKTVDKAKKAAPRGYNEIQIDIEKEKEPINIAAPKSAYFPAAYEMERKRLEEENYYNRRSICEKMDAVSPKRVVWIGKEDERAFGTMTHVGKKCGTYQDSALVQFDYDVDTRINKAKIEGKYLIEQCELLPAEALDSTEVGQSKTDAKRFSPSHPQPFPLAPSITKPDVIPAAFNDKNIQKAHGLRKGIHGRNNSCYLDSTLFAMYYCTDIFDAATLVDNDEDNEMGSRVKKIMRDRIVQALRTQTFCPSNSITDLRNALAPLNDKVRGSFMDVEEFMFILFESALKLKEFIRYSSDTEDFMHQIVPDPNDKKEARPVQFLLESSLKLVGDIKFADVPSPALILEMPRSDGDLVQYKAIIPNLTLDISKLMEYGPRNCLCDNVSTFECSCCMKTNGNDALVYCRDCKENAVNFHTDMTHKPQLVHVQPKNFELKLLAVICIRARHYTAFVRSGVEEDSYWLFFDSMAGAYPEVELAENIGEMLKKLEKNPLYYKEAIRHNHLYRRILTDSHICIYHSPAQT